MQLHQIKRKNPNKKKIKIGRGGKRGKTSGRGHKGQNARAGTRKRPEMRDIIKKLPKKRGYRFKSFKPKPEIINLELIEQNYTAGEKVNPTTLLQKGLIAEKKEAIPQVKLLADGKLTKQVEVSNCLFSKRTQEKIEKAGGKVLAK